MPRKQQGWVTFQASPEELALLEQVAQATQRSKTDILRELVRNLPNPAPAIPPPEPPTAPPPTPAIQMSARNQWHGTIKHLIKDSVNAEVVIELAPGLDLVAVITTRSVDRLGLQEGKPVRAIVKSSNVMLAADPINFE